MIQDTIDIDAGWKEFLRTKVDSLTRWDILNFFYQHPSVVQPADGIAKLIARDVSAVTFALNGLVQAKILVAETIRGSRVYRLASDPEILRQVQQFMEACRNREFRMKVIHHMLA